MRNRRLDQGLLKKLAERLERKMPSVRVMVSTHASRLGITSEAALVLLAKKAGIGTTRFQNKLTDSQKAEIRANIKQPPQLTRPNKPLVLVRNSQGSARSTAINKSQLKTLLSDTELYSRCADLIRAPKHFDRAINQATLVLEDRIRNRANPARRMVGEQLVNHCVNSDTQKTILLASSNGDEQKGFADILRGVILAFRNRTHHHLIDTFTREDAISTCGFINVLLGVVESCKVNNNRD